MQLDNDASVVRPPGRPYPPARRPETVWPAQVSVLVAIALQLLLPERLTVGPTWLLPALEIVLLGGLAIATPRQLQHEHRNRRRAALGMTAVVSAANIASLVLLSREAPAPRLTKRA